MDWYGYGEDVLGNLTVLQERIHRGGYQPQSVLRLWIDKPDGGEHPLGITCVEDKIFQQALEWILQEIYEQEFLGFTAIDFGRDAISTGLWTRCTWPLR